MAEAASAVAGASAAAAAVSSLSERPRAGIVAAAAAAGGLSGFLLWRLVRHGKAGGSGGSSALERALGLLDAAHQRQPRRQEDVLDEMAYCLEVDRWALKLSGGPELASAALRLAARAQRLERNAVSRNGFPEGREGHLKWRAALKCHQEERFTQILHQAGVDEATACRVRRLMAKELPPEEDREMQTLEDAACLVFLERELAVFQVGKDAPKLVDILQKTWRKMSPSAQALALEFDYEPHTLGCLTEAIAVAEKLDRQETPMVAPRLPRACIALLRQSWKQVPKEKFSSEFFERLYGEDPSLQQVCSYPVAQHPQNPWKVVQLMTDLLDVESVPQLERLVHAIAATSSRFGSLRLSHLALFKRALVRTVTNHASKQQKKAVNRAWEAFFYALAAVAGPHLVLEGRLEEVAAATASSLPIPGCGAHAAVLAANGAALLEMSLNITALSQGGNKAPEEVLAKLFEARGWLIDCVRDDVNAYCGLLSSVYAQVVPEDAVAESPLGSSTAEETERRRWLRRAAEVPMRVAELAMGTAVACLPCKSCIKASLKSDWIAGAKLLRISFEISLKNVVINLRDMAGSNKANDVEKRLAKIRDTESPWEDLIDLMP